ncbi:hypothetical protein FQN51_005977 [Onygenales sp. PD_10]|nr:hypothetical protein FQN51_005977 [Onygenales sp. PD_10]
MFNFYGYNPHDTQSPRLRRACEKCHSRKVRCDIGPGKGPCSNCVTYGDDCKLQQRKKKASVRRAQRIPDRGRSQDARSIVHTPAVAASQPHTSHTSVIVHSYSNSTASNIPPTPLVFIQGLVPSVTPPAPSASSVQICSDGFRNASFINRSAVLLDDIPGLDHSNGSSKEKNFQLSEREMKVLELYNAFDLPPVAIRQSLVEAFFERCWTWMPVVDLECLGESPSNPPSFLLLQALFLAGLQMRKGASSYASSEEYFSRVKALLDTGFERNPLTVLAALFIESLGGSGNISSSASWPTQKVFPEYTSCWLASKNLVDCRDSAIAAGHGRPRMINLADCTVERPTVNDFLNPNDRRSLIFVHYVSISGIVGNLSELVTRNRTPSLEAKDAIGRELLNWIRNLPPSLRLYNPDGSSRPYDNEIAQLHVPFFSAITILFRPRSNFRLVPANTAAIVASTINTRLFEAFQLRDHTYSLAGAYAWHFLVAAILQLSCWRIEAFKAEAQAAVVTIEAALKTLGERSPSAANNYRNIQVLRKAFESSAVSGASSRDASTTPTETFSFHPIELFDTFGLEVTSNFHRVESVLAKFDRNINNQNEITFGSAPVVAAAASPAMNAGTLSHTKEREQEPHALPNDDEEISGLLPTDQIDEHPQLTQYPILNDDEQFAPPHTIGPTPPITRTTGDQGVPTDIFDGYSHLLDEGMGQNNWMTEWIDELSF